MDDQEPNGFLVHQEIERANHHPSLRGYPLLPGDLLVRDPENGTFMKVAPGIAVGGFHLTEEQTSRLSPVVFTSNHLEYRYRVVGG